MHMVVAREHSRNSTYALAYKVRTLKFKEKWKVPIMIPYPLAISY